MSEYLSKKAVLEHIRREIGIIERQQDAVMTRHMKEFYGGAIRALQNLEHAIQSGAFDADDSEVQRLRAAIKKAISMWQNTCDFADPEDVIEKMIACLNEALSGAREKEEPNHDNVREKEPQDTFSRAMLRELEKIEEYKRAKEDDGHE
mgnify:CR=1 FL=1